MIENELRGGNYVIIRGDVTKVSYADIVVAVYAKNYHPIPLTEEWLLSIGFETHPLDEELFWIEVCEGVMMTIDLMGNIEIGDDFKRYSEYWHVHQLQNLYFALTGEELKRIEE